MKQLLEGGIISEMACGRNLAYILEDESVFFTTEYKVLQSRQNGCFVRCMRMSWNGKFMLLYMSEQYKALSVLIPSLRPENFMTIVSNLFADIADVRENGFLSCANIDISLEHIYVEPSTFKVKLVYLPSKKKAFGDEATFESALRSVLIKVIQDNRHLVSQKTDQLKGNLSNGKIKFNELLSAHPASAASNTHSGEFPGFSMNENPGSNLTIVALNAPVRFEMNVNKDSYVIGKKPELCDGVITYNKMVSRTHCRIDAVPGGFQVMDLTSANGTYLNRKRLEPGYPALLSDGDILRLADSDFQIIIS